MIRIGARKKKWRMFPVLLMIPFLVAGFMAARILFFWYTPMDEKGREVVVQVPGGSSLVTAAQLLFDAGVVSSMEKFVFMVKVKGQSERIQAGELKFSTDMTPAQVMEVLTRGKAVTYQVTIPEGQNIYQVAILLAARELGSMDRFLYLSKDPEFSRSLGVPGDTLEGFLFPDTYSWPRGLTEEEILGQMVGHYKEIFSQDMKDRAHEIGLTELEVVTLASIIEKETGASEERNLVSAVFHNRLKKGYRLQTDPSVIYGLENFNGNLTKKDLKTDHPYNTYTRSGLPKGPIANPGLASLKAALYPEDVSYLYFVAKGDGTHVFSNTLVEHNEAVRIYQLGGKP